MSNQFFQILLKGTKAYCHVYPEQDGGAKVNINEVTNYLDVRGLEEYNKKELSNILASSEEGEVYVGEWAGTSISESMEINITLDKMRAVCRFYPPSAGGHLLNSREITESLKLHKIKFGINQQEIIKFTLNRQYCQDYLFAAGQNPIHGKDAKIEYFFNTNQNLQPRRNEDGTVDYKDLNTISHIQKGDLLARLTREDPGKPGKNLYGDEINPRTVKTAKLEFGKNIRINGDLTEIYSEVTGHAALVNGKVFVSNVFDVPADVDNSTGNIIYEGSVNVHGNVKAGFSVRAQGDIIVDGVVESAYLEADGQIIVKSGIHGMRQGVLKAGTNVMAKFIENATVRAGGYIEAEIILNSDISAGQRIVVQGRKALINGGVLRAYSYIEAVNIGTAMGTPTELEAGVEPAKKEHYIELRKEVETRSKDLEDVKLIVSTYGAKIAKGERLPADKMKYAQKMAAEYQEKKAELEPLKAELHRLGMEMRELSHSYITASGTVYPGVSISISDVSLNIKSEISRRKFKKQDGEVVSVTI